MVALVTKSDIVLVFWYLGITGFSMSESPNDSLTMNIGAGGVWRVDVREYEHAVGLTSSRLPGYVEWYPTSADQESQSG